MERRLLFFEMNQFKKLKDSFTAAGKSIFSITYYLENNKIQELDDNAVIDISSLAGIISSNSNIQFQFEQLFNIFPDEALFIADKKYREELVYLFRYCFEEFEDSDIGVDEIQIGSDSENEVKEINHKVKKIIDLPDDEIEAFFQLFDDKLYGHEKFKEEFRSAVNSYRVFNKIGEHKILSLFLMGDSGVGKTEVARTIHKALGSNKKLAKINFGNYSSHDALNSLIGSPLGYIGSDGGELLKRVLESDVGVILIDEFEKANSAVYNYFLDVLENGKITNTRAEEYDVNGFIIVFTSNITKDDFKNKISPELRSRFDYVGAFNLLTDEDKAKFVKYRFSEIITQYEKQMGEKLPGNAHVDLVSKVNVAKYSNMRHLNKKIKDTFVKYIKVL